MKANSIKNINAFFLTAAKLLIKWRIRVTFQIFNLKRVIKAKDSKFPNVTIPPIHNPTEYLSNNINRFVPPYLACHPCRISHKAPPNDRLRNRTSANFIHMCAPDRSAIAKNGRNCIKPHTFLNTLIINNLRIKLFYSLLLIFVKLQKRRGI